MKMNNKTGNTNYVCFECGVKFLTKEQKEGEGRAITFNNGECCLCKKETGVTHILLPVEEKTKCSCCHNEFEGQTFCLDCFSNAVEEKQISKEEINHLKSEFYLDCVVEKNEDLVCVHPEVVFRWIKEKIIDPRIIGEEKQVSEEPIKMKELRDKFFDECTDLDGWAAKFNLLPHNVFEWFKPYLKEDIK